VQRDLQDVEGTETIVATGSEHGAGQRTFRRLRMLAAGFEGAIADTCAARHAEVLSAPQERQSRHGSPDA
jgi:hypothetical protein